MKTQDKLLDWAIEIQSLAQAGLTYGKDKFDLVRYERLRDISAEMIAERAAISIEKAKELFAMKAAIRPPRSTREPQYSTAARYCLSMRATAHGRCPAAGATLTAPLRRTSSRRHARRPA